MEKRNNLYLKNDKMINRISKLELIGKIVTKAIDGL